MRIIEKALRPADKRKYTASIIQSAMAGLYILLAFEVMSLLHIEPVIASLGASTFIAFRYPEAQVSRTRFFIGGYCVGVFSGLLCSGLDHLFQNSLLMPGYIPACAVSVFLSMFLMTMFNLEHPPAAALSVAITIDPNPLIAGTAGLICVLVLCVIKKLLKKYLRNLT